MSQQSIAITATGQMSGPGEELFAGLLRDRTIEQFVRQIDNDLREEGVPIPDRPAAAIKAAEAATGQTLKTNVSDSCHSHGPYHDYDLVTRIRSWYHQHYGGALGPAVRIESESDFRRTIEAIDQKLRESSVPIPGRPLAALREISILTKSELRFCSPDHEPRPGRYLGDDLSIRIAQWYDERYGERILMDGSDGKVVVLIRGDPWIMELPCIRGGGGGPNFISEFGRLTTLPSEPVLYRLGDPPPPPTDYNVLDSIAGLPDGLARALTAGECTEILEIFLVGREAYAALQKSKPGGLLLLVRGDLEAAVTHLTGNAPQTGLSKWSSLQATEKVLKTYLEAVVGGYKHGHKLDDFVSRAVGAGLPPIDPAWTQAIQCSAGVRYGEEAVTLTEAVMAHHASLRVVAHAVAHLPPPASNS